ncbi:MAG: peptidoglycan editing factor PgeF [Magnetospiraceae bacterium]
METAGNLRALPGVRHGFLTRRGGRSTGLYASLNCGVGSGDDTPTVRENLDIAREYAGMRDKALVTVRQVHSATVAVVQAPWSEADRPEADALVTTRTDVALGILTADCAPVLFCAPEVGVIGAAHAGWGGAFKGVLEATVAAMGDLGATPLHIHAAIGPCIGPGSYEVGAEFKDRFEAADADNIRFFAPGATSDKCLFDLPGYVSHRLQALNLASVQWTRDDTLPDAERFFSYRRSCHNKEPDYGRQISLVCRDG